MIVDLVLLFVIVVMVAYMVRHYIFTFHATFRPSLQKSYLQTAGIFEPKVSVLIPAHNEEAVIGNVLQRLTETTYPKDKMEVIVVNDASTDKTGEIVDKFADEYPYIKAVHRKNGGNGKPDALNTGLAFSNGEVVLTFDADYYPQRDIIEKLVAPFIDPEVAAVQGRVTVLNEEDSFVSKIVTLDRIGGYRIDQLARDNLILIPQYGGTVGGFKRRILEQVGGWDPNMLTEDTDLTCRFVLDGYQLRYVNDAECYEEGVSNWRSFWGQRYRWAKGHMQVAFKYLGRFLRAKQFSFLEKLEMTMLLNIYFMPILVLVGWTIGILAYIFGVNVMLWQYMGALSIITYSTMGNFAPFFEAGTAAYLDDRKEILWMLPALMTAYLVTVLICTKALIDLSINHKGSHTWVPTVHNGNGNNFLNNNKNGDHVNNGHEWNHTNHNGNGYKYLNNNNKNNSFNSRNHSNNHNRKNSNNNHNSNGRRIW